MLFPEDEFDYEKPEQKSEESKPINNNDNNNLEKPNGSQENNTTTAASFADYQSSQRKRPRQLLTQKIAEEKKLEIEKEIKEEKRKRPKNLLFTTGYSSEENLSDSDSNEEENK